MVLNWHMTLKIHKFHFILSPVNFLNVIYIPSFDFRWCKYYTHNLYATFIQVFFCKHHFYWRILVFPKCYWVSDVFICLKLRQVHTPEGTVTQAIKEPYDICSVTGHVFKGTQFGYVNDIKMNSTNINPSALNTNIYA